jgi:amidase
MATFITLLETAGDGPRLAVKDLIDVAGVPTTAGSAAVARDAIAAADDAACLAGARRAGARIVGKANLHELAFGTSGVNEWSGTPINPLDPRLIPGGSSSGCAVAVGNGEADLSFGSDTGGSVRVPAAFCGITGLKTTIGRIPLEGVRPLAASFDTVGPMARDVAGTTATMELLEPGFAPAASPAQVVGRLRPPVPVDPVIDRAIDDALHAAGLTVVEIVLDGWADAYQAGLDILIPEAAAANRVLLEDPELRLLISEPVRSRLESASAVSAARTAAARLALPRWRDEVAEILQRVELIALPSVGMFPPPIDEAAAHVYNGCTLPVNLAGLPALSQPVRTPGALPASLQLVGPLHSEELLLTTGLVIELAAGQLIDR